MQPRQDAMAESREEPTAAHLRAALDLRLTYGTDALEMLARRITVARQFGETAELDRLGGVYRALIGISAVPPPPQAA